MKAKIRKLIVSVEETQSEMGKAVTPPTRKAAAIAIIENPFAGQYVQDLKPLMDIGEELGGLLTERAVKALGIPGGKAESYGKAAIVGVNGDLEHAPAVLHPKLGKPMRQAVGGGDAIIPSNTKVAAAGATLDVPLANKDNIWSFDELDTMTVSVADAPRPDEIMVVMAVADGGRPRPRVGKGRAAT